MNPDHWLGYACLGLLVFLIVAPIVLWIRKQFPFD